MNSVKIAYIVCSLIFDVVAIALAALAPIYLTEGYYWWTAFGLVAFFLNSVAYGTRLNSWDGMGSA